MVELFLIEMNKDYVHLHLFKNNILKSIHLFLS